MAQHNANQFAGGSAGFLTNQLRGTISSGGMTAALQNQLLSGRKDIARQARTSREGIREQGASSGFSGANANLFNNVFESEANASTRLAGTIGAQADANRFNALGQLGQQSRFEGSQNLAGAQFGEGKRQFGLNFEENKRQFGLEFALEQERFEFEKAQAETGFGDILGSLTGIAAGAFTGGLGSGIASSLTSSLFK